MAPSFIVGCKELLPIGSRRPAYGLRFMVRFLVDLMLFGKELEVAVLVFALCWKAELAEPDPRNPLLASIFLDIMFLHYLKKKVRLLIFHFFSMYYFSVV